MPLIFLHGFLGHPKDWDLVRAQLKRRSLALTLPGHLDQPFSEDITLSVHKQLGEGPHLLVGYSAGGRLALNLKTRFKENYSKVIAFSAHPGLSSEKERKERFETDLLWIQSLRSSSLEDFLKAWYAQPLFEGFQVDLKYRLLHDPKQLALFLEHFSCGKIPVPKIDPETVFICGERDLKYKSLYSKLAPKLKVIQIPQAGHAIHLENPKACAEIIEREINEYIAHSNKSR